MKRIAIILIVIIMPLCSCIQKKKPTDVRIIFLHHSTGQCIWAGNPHRLDYFIGRVFSKITGWKNNRALIPVLLNKYNKKHGSGYSIEDRKFPADQPYGWHNYPYDYYNIWVKHAGDSAYMQEPTLEMLTKDYQVVIFKHCFPVSSILADQDSANINSDYKSIANYKLQYLALREKLHQFPQTKFILWTGAVLVQSQTNEASAIRTRDFFNWVKREWDLPDDNIFIWDFYDLETEGGLYLQNKYATSANNSHPNPSFSDYAARAFFSRLIDIIESNGSNTTLTGSLISR